MKTSVQDKPAPSNARSMEQTKEILRISVLNNRFNPAYPLGDGQPRAPNIPLIQAWWLIFRRAIPADFNEVSLEQAMVAIQQLKDQAGLIQMTHARKLVVPPQLQFVAERLLKSTYSPENANNAVRSSACP